MNKDRIEKIKNKALYQDAEYEDVMVLIEQIERYEKAFEKVEAWLEDEDTDNSRLFLYNLKEIINGDEDEE